MIGNFVCETEKLARQDVLWLKPHVCQVDSTSSWGLDVCCKTDIHHSLRMLTPSLGSTSYTQPAPFSAWHSRPVWEPHCKKH
jgi:hypothetical protein